MIKKRNTIQKALVLEAVLSLKNHPTADQIYTYIIEKYPGISRATVYRNLNFLTEEGRVKRLPVSDTADRFDHNTRGHYHVLCKSCGDFSDIDIVYLSELDKKAAECSGFALNGHDIVFRGICPACQKVYACDAQAHRII